MVGVLSNIQQFDLLVVDRVIIAALEETEQSSSVRYCLKLLLSMLGVGLSRVVAFMDLGHVWDESCMQTFAYLGIDSSVKKSLPSRGLGFISVRK